MIENWADGEERELHAELSRLTLAIVAATLFDADVGNEAEVVGSSLEVVMDYFFSPMRWFRIRERLPLPFDPAVSPRDRSDRRDHLWADPRASGQWP